MSNKNLQYLSEIIYDDTAKKIWARWRNKDDRFLVEYAYDNNGKEIKDRKTTDDLVRFTEYLMLNGINWKWMNIYFRWYDNKQGLLFIGQIASYSKRYQPRQPVPTEGQVNNTSKKLSWKDGVIQAVAAYKELVLSKDRNYY